MNKPLLLSIKKAGVNSKISLKQTLSLAEQFDLSIRDIEIIALENGIIPEKYARNFKTLSAKDQIKLLNSCVTIAGVGGLGANAAEMLARIGIGTIILIDADNFEESNLNRQLFSSVDMFNTSKTQAAEKRIKQINPAVSVKAHNTFLDNSNADELLSGSHVVVDCLDNIKTRFILQKAAKKFAVPLVSAAIAGTCGHVTTISPQDTGFSSIYGSEEKTAQKGVEVLLGNLSYTASFAANIQASETIKIILKKGNTLRNKLFLFDLNENTFDIVEL